MTKTAPLDPTLASILATDWPENAFCEQLPDCVVPALTTASLARMFERCGCPASLLRDRHKALRAWALLRLCVSPWIVEPANREQRRWKLSASQLRYVRALENNDAHLSRCLSAKALAEFDQSASALF